MSNTIDLTGFLEEGKRISESESDDDDDKSTTTFFFSNAEVLAGTFLFGLFFVPAGVWAEFELQELERVAAQVAGRLRRTSVWLGKGLHCC